MFGLDKVERLFTRKLFGRRGQLPGYDGCPFCGSRDLEMQLEKCREAPPNRKAYVYRQVDLYCQHCGTGFGFGTYGSGIKVNDIVKYVRDTWNRRKENNWKRKKKAKSS